MVSSPAQSEPLVSVIIPAFNSAATLGDTLASAAAQSHRALEIIVIDDGSTDATARIAADFCARHPRARLISQTNQGVAAARNRGIAEAKGEFVAPLDADDLWHKDKIARQVAAALASVSPSVAAELNAGMITETNGSDWAGLLTIRCSRCRHAKSNCGPGPFGGYSLLSDQ
jgi:glycosyltransferase involved in cell wall biosynthesis